MPQGQLLAHHPGRVADGRDQAQQHAGDRGASAAGLRDADHDNAAERYLDLWRIMDACLCAPGGRGHNRDEPGRVILEAASRAC
ncbi:MAG: hypothetical protein ACRDPY_33510 [Streptosporangiaceae bacterium]